MAQRLDAAPWRPIHRRIAAALGVGWALDAFEVQIIGSVIPAIAEDFGLSEAQQIAVFVIWFVGIGLGATLFGFLADRFGRRRTFAVTLGVYVVANVGALAGGILVSRTLDARGRKPTLFWAYTAAAATMMGLAAAADSGSPWLTLLAFTAAVFGASCAWMSAYPTFSELYPTHLRATGVGAAVAVGRVGAILGAVLLAQMAASFGLWSAFATLGGLWLLGSVAAAVWWWRGIEARGVSLEQLART